MTQQVDDHDEDPLEFARTAVPPSPASAEGAQARDGMAPTGPAADRRRTEATRVAARVVADVGAVATLIAILWWLEGHDGGFHTPSLGRAVLVSLAALPAVWLESRRLGRTGLLLLALWSVGALAALAFAGDRTEWPAGTLVLAVPPLVFGAARHVARQPWGPVALVALVSVTFGLYWRRSLLQWWGWLLADETPRWMALTWHNQSGTLMAALGVFALGLAGTLRRPLHLGFAIVAALGLTGAWFSGSRGAVAASVFGIGIVTIGTARQRSRGRALEVLATVAALTALTIAALGSLPGTGTPVADPISARTQSATISGSLRIGHMQAALGMIADRPLTGFGPGTYRTMARSFTPSGSRLTAGAHNEYLEAFAEGGLPLGLALVGAVGAGLVAAGRRMRRSGLPDADGDGTRLGGDQPWRSGVSLGASACFVTLSVHQAIDFDWQYPILPALAAVTLGVLTVERTAPAPVPSRGRLTLRLGSLLALVALASAGAWGIAAEVDAGRRAGAATAEQYSRSFTPWDSSKAMLVSRHLWRGGDGAFAVEAMDRTADWNPALPAVRTVSALARYRHGLVDADTVVATLDPPATPFWAYIWVAEDLGFEDRDTAIEVADEAAALMPTYREWGFTDQFDRVTRLRVLLRLEEGACTEARSALEGSTMGDLTASPDVVASLERSIDRACA